MVCHVTFQRRDGNIAQVDCVVVRSLGGIGIEVFFTNPEVGFPTRIDVFTNHRSRVLDSLPGNANALDLFMWEY